MADSVRVRLDLAYDGAGFAGWAKQPGLRTVQGVLEELTTRLLRAAEPVALTVAGRTDAGVHARGQVAHADVPANVTSNRGETLDAVSAIGRWLPGALPADITLKAVSAAPPGFDARFSALSRRYAYRLADSPGALDPLERGFTVAVPPLDDAALAAAAAGLIGLHDFAAFCKAAPGKTTVRTLLALTPLRVAPGRVDLWVEADAFCHNMVRSLAGALVAVGTGKRDAAWPAGLLERRERAGEITVLPAHGLTLEAVRYPPDGELAARNAAARNVREPIGGSGDGTTSPPPGTEGCCGEGPA
jgi:tRNA pseudouridine38-40 synthase